VARALKKLSRPVDVKDPKEKRDEEGISEVYHFRPHGPHLIPFLEHAAEDVRTEPAEVWLEDKCIVAKASSIKAVVEVKSL